MRSNRVCEQKLENNKLKRILVSISLNNKSKWGNYEVKRYINSNINYGSVKGPEVVSILATAAGVEPSTNVARYCKETNEKDQHSISSMFWAAVMSSLTPPG